MANKRNENPNNPESTLYRKLTRLFSGPITTYRRQGPRKRTRRNLDNFKFTSASGQAFKRKDSNPYDSMQANFMTNQARAERYIDFDQMEYTPEIASGLDIYADEMTTSSTFNPLLKINCINEEIKFVLDNLYHNILNVEFNLFGWCRSMCKYGDFFLYLDIDDEQGIKHAISLTQHEVERLEGEDKTNPNYVQYQWNSGGLTFENWQIAHFRILGNDKYAPYGTSVLEPARRIWRQLTLMEDAVMAYRIVRSPERRVFYIDVGNIAANDVEQYMQKIMTQMKRNQIVDQDTGRVDLRYNPMSVEEDYFIPTRAGQNSRVESLPGGTYTGDIDDIKYLRDKLFSALKIPAAYLSNSEEAATENQTTLAQKDIRFARTIQRLQRSIISELEKVAIVHLFTIGYRGEDLKSFSLSLNNPSKIAELQELEHWRTKFDVANGATEGFFSRQWVADNVFGMTEEQFLKNQRQIFYDRKFDATLELAAGAEEEAAAGMAGGGAFEDFGAEEIPGGDELGGEELGAEEPTALDAPAAEDETLLAAPPGKRDDDIPIVKYEKPTGETTTDKSNSKWYLPTKDDKRDMGARRQHWNLNKRMSSSSRKNLFPYMAPFTSLGKGVVTKEGLEMYSEDEEAKIFQVNNDLKKLITEMENRKK